MNNLILIDGDFILYKVCPNKVPSETERMYGVTFEKTLQETLDLVDWYLVEKIFKPTNATEYIAFLGGTGNYRYSVDKNYKEGRTTDKPPYFKEVKEHLVSKWNFTIVDGIESEDAVGITLTSYPDAIIVREDHDLEQLPGVHYNPTKEEFKTITPLQAYYNQWLQCLTGCTTDKVKGIPKVGEKTAAKILEKIQDYSNYPEGVLTQYLLYFGEEEGIEQFAVNYKLLKILRNKKDFIIPTITQVPSKVEDKVEDELKF